MEVAMTDGAKRVRKHREKMKAAGLKPDLGSRRQRARI
jgi:hypothetical protein